MARPKPRLKTFDLPMFNVTITISFCADALVKFIGSPDAAPKPYRGGEVFIWEKDRIPGVAMYFNPNHYSADLLVHESIHAAWRALDLLGIKPTSDDHETLAYVAGYIGKQVNNLYDESWRRTP